jgi:hypothetical protein
VHLLNALPDVLYHTFIRHGSTFVSHIHFYSTSCAASRLSLAAALAPEAPGVLGQYNHAMADR